MLTARDGVEMATIGGARALHLEKEIGSLEAGKRADLIVLATDSPSAQPLYEVYSHLAYALKGTDVVTTVVNGRVLMEDRVMLTIDTARDRRQGPGVPRAHRRGARHPMSARAPRILMIDAEAGLAASLRAHPMLEGCTFEAANGEADALRRLRRRAYDLVITSPRTSVSADLALLEEMRAVRPGVKVIVLAPEATPEDVIAALRAHVFACFAAPFDPAEVVEHGASAPSTASELARRHRGALGDARLAFGCGWTAGCSPRSASWPSCGSCGPRCRRPRGTRPSSASARSCSTPWSTAGASTPTRWWRWPAVRTERTIVYYVRDPGQGFQPEAMEHAAEPRPVRPTPSAHMEKRLEQGLRPGGFGILMAKNVVDELIYSEHGNEVVLIKHLK